MVEFGVLFEVRAEFLNIIYTSFGFKELTTFTLHETYSVINLAEWAGQDM
jgi:hypothetical protein